MSQGEIETVVPVRGRSAGAAHPHVFVIRYPHDSFGSTPRLPKVATSPFECFSCAVIVFVAVAADDRWNINSGGPTRRRCPRERRITAEGSIRNNETDGVLTSPYPSDGSLTQKTSRTKHLIRMTSAFRSSTTSGSRIPPTYHPQTASGQLLCMCVGNRGRRQRSGKDEGGGHVCYKGEATGSGQNLLLNADRCLLRRTRVHKKCFTIPGR